MRGFKRDALIGAATPLYLKYHDFVRQWFNVSPEHKKTKEQKLEDKMKQASYINPFTHAIEHK